ncbi:MAG: tyrosine-protein phosphatase [Planctomycetota bacterium]|nr:tyrosine-protein phosphatase [Planctomycetota bacterium]
MARLVLILVVGLALGAAGLWYARAGDPKTAAPTPPVPAPPSLPLHAKTEKDWAEKLERPGLGNLHKVSDRLYRGAQPTEEGMAELKKLGIKTVVNLRLTASDRDEIGGKDLAYDHIYFNPYHPEDEDMVRFLKLVTDKDRAPVFVHCRHGSDRTGTVCALYRIAVQGWAKEDAIREMTEHDLGFHDDFFQNLVAYLRKMDVAAIQKQAGIAP